MSTTNTWTTAEIADQRGRVFVVTGANSGLGFETARTLARTGATVVMACRSPERAATALDDLRNTVPDADVEVQQLDLASLESVRTAAAALRQRFGAIDALINNAGVMYTERELTRDGIEVQFGTNHLGHFALTLELIDSLEAAPRARVVTIGSLGHRLPYAFDLDDLTATGKYSRFGAYARSKVANLLFSYELDRRLQAAGSTVISLAAHPGASDTEIAEHLPGMKWQRKYLHRLAQPASLGCLPAVRAATDPEAVGGQYYGPDRFLEARGNPTLVRSSGRTHDRELAHRLWTISEELSGSRFPTADVQAPADLG